MCLSLLLIVVDNTIVNVALPTLQRELDASTSELQWVVDSYILVFAGLLLTMGSLGDRFGRKGALAIGLTIIGLASVGQLVGAADRGLIASDIGWRCRRQGLAEQPRPQCLSSCSVAQ